MTPESADLRTRCPVCRTEGRRVRLITLKALLTPQALAQLDGRDYRYCPDPACDAVYFDGSAGSLFRKPDLIVRVGDKESFDPVPVCYCFGYSHEDLRRDALRSAGPEIPRMVASEVRAGHCACEVKNPKGTCCLGDISSALRRLGDVGGMIAASREGPCRIRPLASPPSRSSGLSTSASTESPVPVSCTSSARASD